MSSTAEQVMKAIQIVDREFRYNVGTTEQNTEQLMKDFSNSWGRRDSSYANWRPELYNDRVLQDISDLIMCMENINADLTVPTTIGVKVFSRVRLIYNNIQEQRPISDVEVAFLYHLRGIVNNFKGDKYA